MPRLTRHGPKTRHDWTRELTEVALMSSLLQVEMMILTTVEGEVAKLARKVTEVAGESFIYFILLDQIPFIFLF